MEAATDAAQEAYSVSEEPEWVYTKESWADCLSDIITDPKNDEDFRRYISRSLPWVNSGMMPVSTTNVLCISTCLTMHLANIGALVLENAIKNGVTLENIGDVK